MSTDGLAPDAPAAPQAAGASGNIAVFDLDGTITRRDTYLAFLLDTLRRRPVRLFYCGLLPLAVALFKLKLRDNAFVKERFASAILGQMSRADMAAAARRFVDHLMESEVRPAALERIRAHRAAGDRVVLATASFDAYVDILGERLDVDEIIATRALWNDTGRFTGRIDGRNCYGPEKLVRVKAVLGDRPAGRVVAYSDHHADGPLLGWADDAFAVNPTDKLRTIAAEKGYGLLDWNAPAVEAEAGQGALARS